MKKIVIPIDFSECSLNAVRYAEGLAKVLDAELHVVYVHTPDISVVSTPLGLPYSEILPISAEIHQRIATVRASIQNTGVKVHSYLKEGHLTSIVVCLG